MTGSIPEEPVRGHTRSPRDRDEAEPRRLHPMTLVLRIVVAAPAILFLLLPFLRQPDTASVFNLVIAVLYAVVVMPWLTIHYVRFRYRITSREIVIESGVATRRRRSIPIERIQNVEIEQQLLQRLTGTARVRLYTAGSPRPEGSLEVVSLAEAEHIRASVRERQRAEGVEDGLEKARAVDAEATPVRSESVGGTDSLAPEVAETAASAAESARPAAAALFRMDMSRVLLAGTFRFSMLYVALAFSLLQYLEDDPVVLIQQIMRGPLAGVGDVVTASPVTAAIMGGALAVAVGWLSGILVTLNKLHRFTLVLEERKLQLGQGLLSVRRTTIPLRKVQLLVVRTNPLMRRFGWYTLQVQTMGFDVKEQGHAVVVPFARMEEVERIARVIRSGMPDRADLGEWPGALEPVSRLTIRRGFIRYSVGLAAACGLVAWVWDPVAWYGLTLLPAAAIGAVLRWRHMGYLFTGDHLVVRRGVLRQSTWIMPVARVQVVYRQASLFQRRLGLASVYVDTAGASPVSSPDVIDLPSDVAAELAETVYARFQEAA